MGYFGKLVEKDKAIALRKLGYSYSKILKEVKVSKSTLSVWCRDIKLTEAQNKKLIDFRNKSAQKGSLIAAKKKREEKIARDKKTHELAFKRIGKLNKKNRFIAGIALYLGDGYKTEYRFGFSNADPKIIKFMFHWLIEFGEIDREKINGRIWLHDDLDENLAKDYWSRYLGISKDNFIKSYLVKNKKN
ncbi:MAG: hypothetical protein HN981_00010, partial [Candidatus Pacebacteria bacterium]|nr:hypothetical protein [Candidatus Paceibacterota bacterium]